METQKVSKLVAIYISGNGNEEVVIFSSSHVGSSHLIGTQIDFCVLEAILYGVKRPSTM